MRIDCPACAAAYDVPEGLLAPGRPVLCTRCGKNWVPMPQAKPQAAAAPASRPQPIPIPIPVTAEAAMRIPPPPAGPPRLAPSRNAPSQPPPPQPGLPQPVPPQPPPPQPAPPQSGLSQPTQPRTVQFPPVLPRSGQPRATQLRPAQADDATIARPAPPRPRAPSPPALNTGLPVLQPQSELDPGWTGPILAWIASLLALGGGLAALWRYREAVVAAWPPAGWLLVLLGGA